MCRSVYSQKHERCRLGTDQLWGAPRGCCQPGRHVSYQRGPVGLKRWEGRNGMIINSFTTRMCGNGFKHVIFRLLLWIHIMSTSCEIALRWMWQNFIVNKWPLMSQMPILCSTIIIMIWKHGLIHQPSGQCHVLACWKFNFQKEKHKADANC